ncbi:MAG: hypothetical protein ACI9AX_000931, partial [Polaromonas sp.]
LKPDAGSIAVAAPSGKLGPVERLFVLVLGRAQRAWQARL